MNSIAGNKERLAVSTRGKKYGVSCDGSNAEMCYQTLSRPGSPFLGNVRPGQGGSELSSGCSGASAQPAEARARRRVCPRGRPHTRLALGIFAALSFLLFPASLTFAAFLTSKQS